MFLRATGKEIGQIHSASSHNKTPTRRSIWRGAVNADNHGGEATFCGVLYVARTCFMPQWL